MGVSISVPNNPGIVERFLGAQHYQGCYSSATVDFSNFNLVGDGADASICLGICGGTTWEGDNAWTYKTCILTANRQCYASKLKYDKSLYGARLLDDQCNTPCTGEVNEGTNLVEVCGDANYNLLYNTDPRVDFLTTLTTPSTSATSPTSTTSSTTTTSSTPLTPSTPSTEFVKASDPNWSYQGCYTDSVSARTLLHGLGSRDWTAANCLSLASAAGYKYAGIIYGGECWGADEISAPGELQADDKCNWNCANDASTTCGGEAGLDIYLSNTYVEPTPTSTSTSSDSTATGTDSSATEVATSTPAELKKVDDDATYSYLGCYTDSVSARTLVDGLGSQDWTAKNCLSLAAAQGYKYAGLIYGGECWGADEIASSGSVQSAIECNWKCANDASTTCGGEKGLDVYELRGSTSSTPTDGASSDVPSGSTETAAAPSATASTPSGKVKSADWSYEGCYTDSVSARTLVSGLGSQDWTATNCLELASTAGYKYAGIIFGGECWGANEIASTGELQAASECKWRCANNMRGDSSTCGGEHGLDVYRLTSYTEPSSPSTESSSTSTATDSILTPSAASSSSPSSDTTTASTDAQDASTPSSGTSTPSTSTDTLSTAPSDADGKTVSSDTDDDKSASAAADEQLSASDSSSTSTSTDASSVPVDSTSTSTDSSSTSSDASSPSTPSSAANSPSSDVSSLASSATDSTSTNSEVGSSTSSESATSFDKPEIVETGETGSSSSSDSSSTMTPAEEATSSSPPIPAEPSTTTTSTTSEPTSSSTSAWSSTSTFSTSAPTSTTSTTTTSSTSTTTRASSTTTSTTTSTSRITTTTTSSAPTKTPSSHPTTTAAATSPAATSTTFSCYASGAKPITGYHDNFDKKSGKWSSSDSLRVSGCIDALTAIAAGDKSYRVFPSSISASKGTVIGTRNALTKTGAVVNAEIPLYEADREWATAAQSETSGFKVTFYSTSDSSKDKGGKRRSLIRFD
ncbi:hypothetical protein JCM8547_003569 [Rhodosporidiobolus lusitaniae]